MNRTRQVPQLVTHRAVLGDSRLSDAIGATNHDLLFRTGRGLREDAQWDITDAGCAAEFGLMATRGVDGTLQIRWPRSRRCRQRARERLRKYIHDIVDFVVNDTGQGGLPSADPVLEMTLPDGRRVFTRRYADRVLENAVRLTIARPLAAGASQTAFAYLAGRSRFSAYVFARDLLREGFGYAAKADIEAFYASTQIERVDAALAIRHPEIGSGLRALIRWLHTSQVLRREQHGQLTLHECTGALLAGTCLAGDLSNAIAAFAFEQDIANVFGSRVFVLRYADDFMLLGRSRAYVDDALSFMHELAGASGYRLQRTKTSASAASLYHRPLTWLGKDVSDRGIVTPAGAIHEAALRIGAAPDHHTRRVRVRELLDELLVDPADTLQVAREILADVCPAGLAVFEAELRGWGPRRNRRFNELRVADVRAMFSVMAP